MDNYVNLGRWFSIMYRRSQQFVVEACEELGLTYSEFVLLVRLHDNEGAKQDELAANLFLDKAVVTRTLNSLEAKGYLQRKADAADRRVRHVYLTDFGKEKHTYFRNVIQRWTDYLFAELSKEDAGIVFRSLEKLTDRACKADLQELAKDIPQGDMQGK